MASNEQFNITAFGWNDGCPVHLLTTADGGRLSSVQHCIGSQATIVQALVAIGKYNHSMQAIDCHDQLHQLFSLTAQHEFKKYHKVLMMALFDFALVNADIHYHMAN